MFNCTDYSKIFKDFQIVTTSRNTILKKDKKIYSTMVNDFKLLNLIQQYKKEIKNNFDLDAWNYKKVTYYEKNIKNFIEAKESTKKIYVYDVNHAYLSIIKKYNLISDDLFLKINEFYKTDKTKVMAVIGSVATRKKIDYYENYKLVNTDIKQDKEGLLIWNFIENKLSDIILDFKFNNNNNDNFVYYWFDEIAFNTEIDFDINIFKMNKAIITNRNDIYYYEKKELKRFDFLNK